MSLIDLKNAKWILTRNASTGWVCWVNTVENNPITSIQTWFSKSIRAFIKARTRRSNSDGFEASDSDVLSWELWWKFKKKLNFQSVS